MALYSLIIERGGKYYSTQLRADSATAAIRQYFTTPYQHSGREFFGDSSPSLTAKDIIYVTPMEGLVNMWVACAGREGEYVSVICSRTVSRSAA
jgi:hypothetical protein